MIILLVFLAGDSDACHLHFSCLVHSCINFVVIVVNVNRAKDFAETRKHEQEMERQVMQNVRRMAHDSMTEKQDVRRVCCGICCSNLTVTMLCLFGHIWQIFALCLRFLDLK